MADKPIIFSAAMVRALLDGRKSQTRRVLKPQPPATRRGKPWASVEDLIAGFGYAVGNRLWVREAWRTIAAHDACNATEIARRCSAAGYKSTWAPIEYVADAASSGCFDWPKGAAAGRYRHARFMPRWASRITLTVTDVRVQRLQEITEEDARAEGVKQSNDADWPWHNYRGGPPFVNATSSFMSLWDSLYGAGAWGGNPWVAAITFTVERRNIDA